MIHQVYSLFKSLKSTDSPSGLFELVSGEKIKIAPSELIEMLHRYLTEKEKEGIDFLLSGYNRSRG
jgi:hypothetical protein